MKPLILKLDESRFRALLGSIHHVVTALHPEEIGELHEYYMLLSICEELYKKVAGHPEKIKLRYYQVVALEKALMHWPISRSYGVTALLQDLQPHIHSRYQRQQA